MQTSNVCRLNPEKTFLYLHISGFIMNESEPFSFNHQVMVVLDLFFVGTTEASVRESLD